MLINQCILIKIHSIGLKYKFKVGVVKSIINFRENKNLGLNTKRIYVEEQESKKTFN